MHWWHGQRSRFGNGVIRAVLRHLGTMAVSSSSLFGLQKGSALKSVVNEWARAAVEQLSFKLIKSGSCTRKYTTRPYLVIVSCCICRSLLPELLSGGVRILFLPGSLSVMVDFNLYFRRGDVAFSAFSIKKILSVSGRESAHLATIAVRGRSDSITSTH